MRCRGNKELSSSLFSYICSYLVGLWSLKAYGHEVCRYLESVACVDVTSASFCKSAVYQAHASELLALMKRGVWLHVTGDSGAE
jgi:hypothetical protein